MYAFVAHECEWELILLNVVDRINTLFTLPILEKRIVKATRRTLPKVTVELVGSDDVAADDVAD